MPGCLLIDGTCAEKDQLKETADTGTNWIVFALVAIAVFMSATDTKRDNLGSARSLAIRRWQHRLEP